MTPSTTVIATVLAHNNPNGLAEVLRRLVAQVRPPDAVVVVDNASDIPISIVGAELGTLPVRVVRSELNRGVGGGHNLGVRIARQEFGPGAIWILEHDTYPDNHCLAALLEAGAQHHEPVVVATELVRNNYERAWIDETDAAEEIEQCTFNGPLIDVAVLDSVGPFNEGYFVGQEDWDFSQRVRDAGFAIIRCRSAVAIHPHKGDQRFDSYVSPTRLYYSARNLLADRAPLGRAEQLEELCLTSGKCVHELTRRHRGRRYAAARWWAYWDGRAGRMGEQRHPSISGPSGPSTPSTARAA